MVVQMVIGVSSGVVMVVSLTAGGLLTGVTVILICAVSQRTGVPLSQTITQMLSLPLKFGFVV